MKNTPLLEKIQQLIANAKPDEVAGVPTLERIKDDLAKQALALEKVKREKLVEVCELWSLDGTKVRNWSDFCEMYLRMQGFKTISKRKLGGGGGGKRKVNTIPMTEELIKEAKKLYQQSLWKSNVHGLAKHLKVNTNSLKKHLGIPRRGFRPQTQSS